MGTEDSQSSFLNQDGELILAQAMCLHMNGPLGYMGLMTLTSGRIIFEPRGMMDRFVGAQTRTFEFDRITEVSFGGLQNTLTLRMEDSKTRFSGAGARQIWDRARGLWHDKGIKGGEPGPYEPTERVLVAGSVHLVNSGLLGSDGEATLTDRRVVYRPSKGLDKLPWRSRGEDIDIALDDITEFNLKNLGRKLVVSTAEKSYQFSGSLVPQLYNSLSSLGPAGTVFEERTEVLATWDGMRFFGVLGSRGQVVITERSLHYQPSGRLDVAIGVSGEDIDFTDIHEMECSGWPEKRLKLTLADRSLTLGLDDLMEKFQDLAPLVVAAVGEKSLKISNAMDCRADDVTHVIGERADSFQIPWDEKVMTMSPAARWQGQFRVERGWLILTDQQLHFLPLNQKLSIESFTLDLTLPPPGDDFDPLELHFELAGVVHRFIPLSADRFTAQFWTLMDRGSEDNAWRRKWGTDFRNIIGELPSLEINRDGVPIAKLRPAVTVAHSNGFGIVFPGEPTADMMPGTDLEISVNNEGGRYRFKGTVVKHERHTPTQGGGGGDTYLIVVAHTPLLAVANRRAYYRVPVQDRVAVIPQSPDGEGQTHAAWCLFQNLSVGGCALYSDREFHEEQRLFVLLPTPQLKLRVRAEVLSARRSPSGPLPYSYRIGFIHKSSKQMIAVGDLVMHIQRKLLIEQGELEADEDENVRTRAILKDSMNMGRTNK